MDLNLNFNRINGDNNNIYGKKTNISQYISAKKIVNGD